MHVLTAGDTIGYPGAKGHALHRSLARRTGSWLSDARRSVKRTNGGNRRRPARVGVGCDAHRIAESARFGGGGNRVVCHLSGLRALEESYLRLWRRRHSLGGRRSYFRNRRCRDLYLHWLWRLDHRLGRVYFGLRRLNLRRRRNHAHLGNRRWHIRLGLYGKYQNSGIFLLHFHLMHTRCSEKNQKGAYADVHYQAHAKRAEPALRFG